MVRIFQMFAVILAGVAAFFFWTGTSDMTFVTGVLAACSFFLSIRYQMKARLVERERNAVTVKEPTDEEVADKQMPHS